MSQLEPVSCDVADEGGPEAREHRGDADARCVGGRLPKSRAYMRGGVLPVVLPMSIRPS